jgi:uncharacterized membrane protein YebE (DUF533 family)
MLGKAGLKQRLQVLAEWELSVITQHIESKGTDAPISAWIIRHIGQPESIDRWKDSPSA